MGIKNRELKITSGLISPVFIMGWGWEWEWNEHNSIEKRFLILGSV